MSKTLLMVVNSPTFFMSHFFPIAKEAKAAGYDVYLASMAGDSVEEIEGAGITHFVLPMSRSGKGLFGELRTFCAIWLLFWKIKPDVVHLMTIKPVLYGGIAALIAPVKGVLSVITGLGFVFLGEGFKAKFLKSIIGRIYRLALCKRNLRVLFENPDDRDTLYVLGAFPEGKAELVRGAGVDLAQYAYVPERIQSPIVCLAARLLRDKGVFEFVAAAKILRERGIDARFQLIGDIDPGNPATATENDLQQWQSDGIVELLGFRSDVPQLFAAANVVVLPSYREGLPKVLLEAAACGRAVITTDVPGCRHAIEQNVSGLLVPLQNVDELAAAIKRLVSDPELRHKMGKAGRELAEREFSIDKIVRQYLEIYRKLEKC
tara:strand:+ start:1585 stop:2712 length:1128 start_codon:yes stop_codon:yes gene_type:complete